MKLGKAIFAPNANQTKQGFMIFGKLKRMGGAEFAAGNARIANTGGLQLKLCSGILLNIYKKNSQNLLNIPILPFRMARCIMFTEFNERRLRSWKTKNIKAGISVTRVMVTL